MGKINSNLKYTKNPRKITKKQFSLLKEHLEELGDLSGVVFDVNSKMYVGGNQRSEVFNGADIEIVERFDPPTPQHTTAHGFIKYLGEKYTYREVSFTPEQFEKACIVANHDGGKWDMDILANEFEMENLLDWGFEEFELGISNININDIETSDEFTLKDGDKAPFQQMTFTLADEQAEQIKNAIANIKQTEEYKYAETMGNENSNGNALYLIVMQWAEQRK